MNIINRILLQRKFWKYPHRKPFTKWWWNTNKKSTIMFYGFVLGIGTTTAFLHDFEKPHLHGMFSVIMTPIILSLITHPLTTIGLTSLVGIKVIEYNYKNNLLKKSLKNI